MPLVPENVAARIAFYDAHLSAWEESASQIGLAPSDIEELRAKVVAAQAAMLARDAALDTARSLTASMHEAVDAMHALGSADILKIRLRARLENDPQVFTKANLPLPKDPSPVGLPAIPTSFASRLLCDGALELSWKCRTPGDHGGTLYEVARLIPTYDANGREHGATIILGITAVKRFTDTTLPAGTAAVQYFVTPIRGAGGVASERTSRGATGTTVINLGVRQDGSRARRLAA